MSRLSVFSLWGLREGRGGCLRNHGHEHDFCQAQKAKTPIPARTNDAVKYATARGHLTHTHTHTHSLLHFAALRDTLRHFQACVLSAINMSRERKKGPRVFSLEESLESLNSLKSLENGRILLCFPESWGSLESLESQNSLESLEIDFSEKTPFPKDPFFRTRSS